MRSENKADSTPDQGESRLNTIQQFMETLLENSHEGLAEILGVLEAGEQDYAQLETPGQQDNDDRNLILDEVLALVRLHLENPLDDSSIDDLLFGVAEFCDRANLLDDDIALLKKLLTQDSVKENYTVNDARNIDSNDNKTLKTTTCLAHIQQLEIQALSNQMNAVHELLDALKHWMHDQTGTDQSTTIDHHALDKLLDLINQYLDCNATSDTVQNIVVLVSQLTENSVIQEDEVQEYCEILIQEASFLTDQNTRSLSPESDITVLNDISEPAVSSNLSKPVAEIPDHLKEFIPFLKQTASELIDCLSITLKSLYENSGDRQQLNPNLELNQNYIEKFSGITALAGFEGLQQSCEHIQENYDHLIKNQCTLSQACYQIWMEWNATVLDYLQSPLDEFTINQLLIIHCSTDWLVTLDEGKTAELLIKLKALGSGVDEENSATRQTVASEDDVSLKTPEDVFPELLDSLLQELPGLTEQFSVAVQYLSRGGRKNDVMTAQRVAHTIKGAGNTVGIKGIANLTHHLEDILTALANADSMPGPVISTTLVRASDCLEEMSEALTKNGPAPLDARDVLQEVLDLACQIDRDGIQIKAIDVNQQSQVKTEENSQSSNDTEARSTEEAVEQSLRVSVSMVDKLMQHSNEMLIVNSQLRELLKQTMLKNKSLQNQLDLIDRLGNELQELVDIRNYDIMRGVAQSSTADKFDTLEMDQYNELHSCSRRIHEVATDIKEIGINYRKDIQDIDNMLVEQGYLNHVSQGDLLTLRQIPVKSVSSRLQRSVRQACRLTGKSVNLIIQGEELNIDRDILNGVIDPLMHVLRNAVDHGIEKDEKRQELGKQATGIIRLTFSKSGNTIEITCQDDGAGLNLDAIRKKAIERKIIEESEQLTEEELKHLIFRPNFSTSDQVTQVSGRGVGMDAVSSGIRTLGGTLSLESKLNQGCLLSITLPLSLVHYHSLIVKVGKQRLALAEHTIEQILHPGAGRLERDRDQLDFIYENQVYPVKTLDSLLSRVTPDNSISLDKRIIILVKHQNEQHAILIEHVEGVSELVVKQMGEFVPKIHGIIGASILDDGSIAPVLDVQELVSESRHWSDTDLDQVDAELVELQTSILVVDDSLSARRSLEQFVGDLGFTVKSARDGQEAIELISEQIPDMVITDMEMPRINGIELAEFIRSNPDTATLNIPIIMITSRSTTKHKQLAHSKGIDVYLTKPYSEHELTNHITTLFNISEQPQTAISA